MLSLVFLGLQGMLDPPRPEALAAVQACQRAGITVKMITGDHRDTARWVAAQLGLGRTGAVRAIDGLELEGLSGQALQELAQRSDVFARVAPAQKLALVEALQAG